MTTIFYRDANPIVVTPDLFAASREFTISTCTGYADSKGSCSSADILWFRVMDLTTSTGGARCARGAAPNVQRELQRIGRESTSRHVWADFRTYREERRKLLDSRGSPGSILARNNCGLLDLTNDGEFVLDCVVGDQYPHGLASITGTKQVFCVDKQQSILLGSPVKAQLREALSALEGKITPDLLVELCDVHQLDLLLEGKP